MFSAIAYPTRYQKDRYCVSLQLTKSFLYHKGKDEGLVEFSVRGKVHYPDWEMQH